MLDLGSGRAPYLDVLRGDVICVDLFPPFLAELSSRSRPGCRVHAVCASAVELPFPEGVADVVFASELIEHLGARGCRPRLGDVAALCAVLVRHRHTERP